MRWFIPLVLLAACAAEEPPATPPADPGAYGPENAWYHANADEVPTPPAAGRFAVGQLSPELLLPDQDGDLVSSYQFAGKLLLLDVFSDHGEEWEEPIEGACPT
jgi:hypothetical protein